MFTSALLLVFLFLMSSSAWARDLYVDVAGVHGKCSNSFSYSGNDQTHPWCTLQKADDNVRPGDTVIVADGTYNTVGGSPDGLDTLLDVHNGGTSTAWVTFEAEHYGQAILSGNNYAMEFGVSFRAGADYIKIIGFHFKEFRVGIDGNEGTGNHDYYIAHNEFDGMGHVCSDPGTTNYDDPLNGGQGIFMGAETGNYTIDSNVFHDTGMTHPCLASSVSYQEYSHDHPLYINGHDVTVINNIFYNNTSGREIQMGGGSSTPSLNQNWLIADNTFTSYNPHVDGQITIWDYDVAPPTNVAIANNIFYNAAVAAVQSTYLGGDASSSGMNWIFYNNLVYGSKLLQTDNGTVTGYTSANNLVGSGYDPDFVNVAGHDYHLQAGSPAIGNGIYVIGYDADGNTRTGNTDIGAYEYESGDLNPPAPALSSADNTPPSTPAGVTATAASSSQINLTWTPSTDNVGVAGYEVYRNGSQIATSVGTTYADSGLQPSTSYTYNVVAYDAAGNSSSMSSPLTATTSSISTSTSPTTKTYISDLQWVGTPANGWGPAEKDMSNGEQAAGDGHTITLNGVTYTKGLGVHAYSQVTYNLGGNYSRFISDIGIDDEVGSLGSVVFQVWADGVKIYDSGVMTGSSATKTVNVDVTGVNQLQLVVTDAGDNNYDDHADWAGAYFVGTGSGTVAPATVKTYISDLQWVGTPANGWGPAEKDMSNGEQAAGDGHTITLNGVTYAKGLGVHAYSQVTYNLGGNYSRFISDIGIDDEVGSLGSVVFQVWADGVKIYDSGVMTGSSATKTVNVDVTGVNQLQLVVTDAGDNNYDDHSDWAGAYLTSGSN